MFLLEAVLTIAHTYLELKEFCEWFINPIVEKIYSDHRGKCVLDEEIL